MLPLLVNLLLLGLICIGHAGLVAAVTNRVFGLPFSRRVFWKIRRIHDLLQLGFPPLLIISQGIYGARLLRGGVWSDLPIPWQCYIAICGLMVLGLVILAALRLFHRDPQQLRVSHTETIDIARRLGNRPVSRNHLYPLTLLPGNEILRLQVSGKRLAVPGLPAEWKGLSILHVSDLHYIGSPTLTYFAEVMRIAAGQSADLIVFTGDLVDRPELVDWLPATLGQLSAPLGCYFVLGNHDWHCGTADQTRQRMTELGWVDIASRWVSIEHHGLPLVVAGTELPWMGTFPDLAGAPAEAFRLLLSHTPDNIGWARREKFDLMLAGHNHGGQIRLPGFGPVFCPSLYGCRYASGTFWESPTLLHVSRGISGTEPIRFRCPPDLTHLVLE